MTLPEIVSQVLPALLGASVAVALFAFFSRGSVESIVDLHANLQQVDALVRADRTREALDLARRLAREAPNNLRARIAVVDVLHKRGAVAEARRELEALERDRPGHVEVRARLDTL
jgi:hypothetical protein